LKTKITALIAINSQDISKYHLICKNSGVTHWINLVNSNQIRNHIRKNGPTQVCLVDERIGPESGINLVQELANAGSENIIFFSKKLDLVSLNQILRKEIRVIVFKEKITIPKKNWNLTKSEKTLVQDLSLGMSMHAIALHLKISVSTTKSLLRNVRKKGGIHDRSLIVAHALRDGVIG
jgi:DNA-binding CsgD family transcriptional regulator